MAVQEGPGALLEKLRRLNESKNFVGLAVSVGIVSAVAGIEIGLRMALHATVVQCSSRPSYSPCYAHRHAGDGAAIVLLSVMLAVVISICGVIAHASLAGLSPDKDAASSSQSSR